MLEMAFAGVTDKVSDQGLSPGVPSLSIYFSLKYPAVKFSSELPSGNRARFIGRRALQKAASDISRV